MSSCHSYGFIFLPICQTIKLILIFLSETNLIPYSPETFPLLYIYTHKKNDARINWWPKNSLPTNSYISKSKFVLSFGTLSNMNEPPKYSYPYPAQGKLILLSLSFILSPWELVIWDYLLWKKQKIICKTSEISFFCTWLFCVITN